MNYSLYLLLKTQMLSTYPEPLFYFQGPNLPVASLKFLSQVYMWQGPCAMLISFLLTSISAIDTAISGLPDFLLHAIKMRKRILIMGNNDL